MQGRLPYNCCICLLRSIAKVEARRVELGVVEGIAVEEMMMVVLRRLIQRKEEAAQRQSTWVQTRRWTFEVTSISSVLPAVSSLPMYQ